MVVKTRAVQVRMTRQQYELLKQNMERRGFRSLSTYIRHVALYQEFMIEEKVREVHEFLLGPEKKGRKKGWKPTPPPKSPGRDWKHP